MTLAKPKRVFIGSSTKYIKLAHAFRMTFEHDTDLSVEVWDISNWRDMYDNLTSLIGFLDQFQFGIFLLTPDEQLAKTTTKDKLDVPRDNVIFELGMWLGRAGRDRTWHVVPSNVNVKIPTDLNGLNAIKYLHPGEQEYRSNEPPHFRSAFANAHDFVLANIKDYQQSASQTVFSTRIRSLQEKLKNAGEEEITKVLQEGLGQLLRERAAIAKMSMADTLSDILGWTQTLLNGLNGEDLAAEQDAQYREVWVFAPEPIEALSASGSANIRKVVRQNIFERGVKYRYFVDDNSKIERIKAILLEAGKGTRDAERRVADQVSFVVLPEEHFLSFFTIHFFSVDHTVYQSVVRDNRDDFLIRLDAGRADLTKKMIEKLLVRHGVLNWPGNGQSRTKNNKKTRISPSFLTGGNTPVA
jgi:hypothetical protein